MLRKSEIALFSAVLADELKLLSIPIVEVKPSIKWKKCPCWGLYITNDNKNHIVWLARNAITTKSELFAVMAHEFVHAWQTEKGYNTGHGAKSKFDYWANYFAYWYNFDIVEMV
jgi:Zn-dependent peptidase ImmA (M78 family)